jgi:hypothetical protein
MPEGAAEARAHILHQGVPRGGGNAGQGGESVDGARVWPDVPAAASAKKLAKWDGSAGRNGVPARPANTSHRTRVEA